MADFEIKKTSKRQKKQKMLRSVKCANTSRIRRIRPKNARFISPFDCLYSVAKKYDSYASENTHCMCISFILRSVQLFSWWGIFPISNEMKAWCRSSEK